MAYCRQATPARSVTSVNFRIRRSPAPTWQIVPEQPVAGPRARRSGCGVERAALQQQRVEVAVVVVVEQRDPGAHLFSDVVLAGRAIHVGEREAGGGR